MVFNIMKSQKRQENYLRDCVVNIISTVLLFRKFYVIIMKSVDTGRK